VRSEVQVGSLKQNEQVNELKVQLHAEQQLRRELEGKLAQVQQDLVGSREELEVRNGELCSVHEHASKEAEHLREDSAQLVRQLKQVGLSSSQVPCVFLSLSLSLLVLLFCFERSQTLELLNHLFSLFFGTLPNFSLSQVSTMLFSLCLSFVSLSIQVHSLLFDGCHI
jgi:hypothetical protein